MEAQEELPRAWELTKEQEHICHHPPSRRAEFVQILSMELLDQVRSMYMVYRYLAMIFRAIAVHKVLQASPVVFLQSWRGS